MKKVNSLCSFFQIIKKNQFSKIRRISVPFDHSEHRISMHILYVTDTSFLNTFEDERKSKGKEIPILDTQKFQNSKVSIKKKKERDESFPKHQPFEVQSLNFTLNLRNKRLNFNTFFLFQAHFRPSANK